MAEKEYAPKKMLTLHILDILKRFSDEEHRLSQKQIQDILADENEKYKMSVDRKAIKRNLQDLIDAGYDIQCEERNRGSGETANSIKTGFYIERDFTRIISGNPELLRVVAGHERTFGKTGSFQT